MEWWSKLFCKYASDHNKVKDEFLDKVLKRIKNIKVGDPLDTETNMGSMISKSHLAKVDSYIQKGIDEGASILHGGVSDINQKGFFAKPTLFDNVKENMINFWSCSWSAYSK